MDEPALKKARVDSECDGEGLDALSELEKLDPLPTSGSDAEQAASTSSMSSGGPGSIGGASGGAPSSVPPPSQPSTSTAASAPATSGGFPGQNGSSSQQPGPGNPSVLQELLMAQSQGATNSPRPQPYSQQQAPQGAVFNTRSPLMHNGPSAMMSPPTSMGQRVPGPSPGAPQGGPQQMRGQAPMYPGDGGMIMSQGQQYQMMPGGQAMRYYQQPGPAGGPGMPFPGAAGVPAGRGAQPPQMGRAPPGAAIINGAPMGRGMPPQGRGMGALMPNQMMRPHGMMEAPFGGAYGGPPGQRPDPYLQQYMMRGQYPVMPHGQQAMMMDANGSHLARTGVPGQPPGQGPASMIPMTNGNAHAMANHSANMAIAAARGGSGTPGGSGQDPEKRKLIQQQLVLLLHAHKCQQRERADNNSNGRGSSCTLPHCSTMKEVLQHMTTCNNGRVCQYAHCASSRQIIAHWKNCTRDDCPVCNPFRRIQDNPNDIAFDIMLMNGPGSVGPSSVGSVNPFAAPGNGPASIQNDLASQFGSPTPIDPQQPSQQAINARHSLFEGYPGDPFRLANMPNEQRSQGQGSSGSVVGSNAGSASRAVPEYNLPAPEVPDTTKEWHTDVNKDLRNHLVGKLVKAIFPSPVPHAMNDRRLRELILYARKVEKEMFESANNREEYYHFLAEKIYKIQKELQEKKNYRVAQITPGNAAPSQQVPQDLYSDLADLMSDAPMPSTSMERAPGGGGPVPVPSSADGPGVSGAQPGQAPWMSSGTSQSGVNVPQMGFPGRTQFSAPGSNGQAGNINNPVKQEVMDTSENGTPNSTPFMNGPSSASSMSCSTPATNGVPPRQVKEELKESSPTNSQDSESSMPAIKKEETPAPKEPAVVVKREPTPPPGEDVVFTADELRHHLRPVWDKLDQSDDAIPFRVPVDPILLNIPDYRDIVKHPMDLETIMKRLDNGFYKNPWQFCDDIWLMFDNAWLYNRKNSKVYKYSTKLSEMFVQEMDPVMREMGYCCARKLSFTPLALFCYGAAMCTIARDQPYWVYESNSNQYGVVVSERYTYCVKCFENLPPEGISLSENPNDTSNMASKDKFLQMKNNVIDMEPFETCKYCHRKWHRICALHDRKVFTEGFICDTCRNQKNYVKPDNKFLAKKLPTNKLSQYLEDRVNTYIKDRIPSRAESCQVIIRTLCVQDKEVEVKTQMKAKYSLNGEGFPERFPYRTKAIFAFEVIDGVEVCFFGLHVQEYGSNCPAPNARRVYIAYLDSVHFFQPRELRTDVYHEILLGYLDYVKKLGFTMAHIWACPPSEGDDYIFHCHPPEQKIPKPKRLQDWYKKMLEKGVEEKTVVEFKDIYKQARDDNLTSPAELPYFEGDFWPNVIEDCIREASNEEALRKKEEGDDDEGEDVFAAGDNGKKKSSKSKKNNLKKNAKMNKKKQGSLTGNEIGDKLFLQFEKHKEVFFTIRLVPLQIEQNLTTPTTDPDPLMNSEMMDGRDTFLTRAREEHWEFSSLRRAKFSTLCLAYTLHVSDSSKGIEYTCNKCSNNNAKYHCSTCEDFDLCETCHAIVKHEHPMEVLKSIMGETMSEAGNNRLDSIQRCIQSLVHACQCRDANCRRMSCHKMKRVVQHTKMCKKRINASCPVCKQLIALCCYHAKHCSRDQCSVPFCMNIRQKLAEQKRSIARRADMMMRRRMEGLQSGGGGSSMSTPSVTSAPTPPSAPNAGPLHSKGGGPPLPSPLAQTSLVSTNGGGLGQQMTSLGGSMASSMPGITPLGQPQPLPRYMAQPPMNQQPPPQQQQQQQQYGNGIAPRPGMYGQMQRPGQPPGSMGMGSSLIGPGGLQGPQGMQRPGPGGPMDGMNPANYNRPNQPGMNPYGHPQMQIPGGVRPGPGPGPGLGRPGMPGPGMLQNFPSTDPSLKPQLVKIKERLMKAKTTEEGEAVFHDLKKTPHLFTAFLQDPTSQAMGYVPQHQQPPHYYQGPPSQPNRGPGGQFAPMNASASWHQQQQQQQQQQQRGQQGAQFGVAQGRSPLLGMGSSPMMGATAGQQQQQPGQVPQQQTGPNHQPGQPPPQPDQQGGFR